MKKILVTGDRGYIGSVLVPLLIKNKFEVTGIDTNYFRYTFPGNPILRYKKITKDIRKIEKKDLEGIEAVIHLSALSNDPMGEIDASLTEEINFKASAKLAVLAKKAGVKRFIFSSSCSVYGGKGKVPVTEKDSLDPLTSYAKSKVDTENFLREIADDKFSPVILRNSTVYGCSPKQRMDLVVNNLVAWAVTTGKINLLSDGKAWRPLIDVYDLSRIFLLMLKSPKELIHNETFNIGSTNQNYLVKDVALEINKKMPKCQITFGIGATFDKRNYRVNFDKLEKTFPDFKFKINLSKSISNLIKEFSKINLTKKEFESDKYIRINRIKKLLVSKKLNKNLYWIR